MSEEEATALIREALEVFRLLFAASTNKLLRHLTKQCFHCDQDFQSCAAVFSTSFFSFSPRLRGGSPAANLI